MHQVRLTDGAQQPLGKLDPEELDDGRDPALLCDGRDVCRRVDPEHADAPRQEVLEEIAVVRGDLDHAALGRELEPIHDHLDIARGVGHPGVRVRREVGVFAKELGRLDDCRQLCEPAVRAETDVERVEGLRLLHPARRDEALAQRRAPEVDDGHFEGLAAGAAVRCTGDHLACRLS